MDNLSNCQVIPPTKSKGFSECQGIFQKVFLFLFLGLFLFSGELMAQGGRGNPGNVTGTNTENILGSYPVAPEDFPGCNQNNVTAIEVIFRDIDGNDIDPNNPPADQDPNVEGIQIIGTLYVVFGGSTNNAYSVYTQFDIIRDGIESSRETIVGCVSQGENVVPFTEEYLVGEFTWTYGELLEVENIFATWSTGNAKGDEPCSVTTRDAQCFTNAEGFTVTTPLVPDFSFITDCSLEVDFFNETTGGNDEVSYSYSWDFDNDGNEDSFIENPSYTFPSAGTYPVTLTVTNDGFSISETQDVSVYNPISISSSKEDIDCSEGTGGKIEITQLIGGFGEYTIEWASDDENFVFDDPAALIQSNLPIGTYTVTVTDERGCTNSQTYNIDQQGNTPTPLVEDQAVCEAAGSLDYDVTATNGLDLIFYQTENSLDPISPTSVDTSIPGVYSVWVSQSNDFCESARVEVTITVNPAPDAPTNPIDVTICEGDAESITASATVPAGFTIKWY
ncbi:PKD domain-containing protein, partial [Algoriphagus sp.]|uniref:PKD domain-containing protein n=1 Tax=Algoriphagus sp. TaxID=1872435 RepID=UPI0026154424